jgi:threonine dehydrogenase-like Zn-dependent dehydrogenase
MTTEAEVIQQRINDLQKFLDEESSCGTEKADEVLTEIRELEKSICHECLGEGEVADNSYVRGDRINPNEDIPCKGCRGRGVA